MDVSKPTITVDVKGAPWIDHDGLSLELSVEFHSDGTGDQCAARRARLDVERVLRGPVPLKP